MATRSKKNLIRVDRWLESGKQENLYIDVKVPVENFDVVEISFRTVGSDQRMLVDNLRVWEVK